MNTRFFLSLFAGSLLLLLPIVNFAAEYSVDRLNRVTQVSYAAGQVIAYEYDAAGNILAIKPKYTPTPTQPQVSLEVITAADQRLTNNPISFKATPKDYPANISITQYGWDWNGDGIIDENGSSATTQHTYTQAGSYNTTVTATDSSGGKTKSPAVSLTVTTPMQQTAPDLIATIPDFYQMPIAGQQQAFTATVKNIGKKDAAGSGTLKVYASTDATITSADSLVGSTSFIALPVNGYQLVGGQITVPSVAGKYWFGACADVAAGETNTSNNCSSGVEWTVAAVAPDLTLNNFSFGGNLDAGQKEGFLLTVNNTGNQSVASSTTKLYMSTDSTVNSADTVVATINSALLSANGGKQDLGGQFTAPEAGNYWLAACVDPVAGETNTSNNCTETLAKEVWATGTINAVTPFTATLGQLTTFTVQGVDMANTMTFALADCNNIQKLPGGSSTQQQFTCTPTGTAGNKAGELRNYAAGVLLNSFTVNVVNSPDKPDLAVSITNPASVTPDTFTKHSVNVQNIGKADAENVVLVIKAPDDMKTDGSNKSKAEPVAMELTQGTADCPLSSTSSWPKVGCQDITPTGFKDNVFRLGAVKAGQTANVTLTERYSGYNAGETLQISATVTSTIAESSTSNNSAAQSFALQNKKLVQGCDYENLAWTSPLNRSEASNMPVQLRSIVFAPTSDKLPLQIFGFGRSTQQYLFEGDGFYWKGVAHDSSYPMSLRTVAYSSAVGRYVGASMSDGIYWSMDRSSWFKASVPMTALMSDVEYFNGRYVAVGDNGVILTSADGVSWSQANSGVNARISYIDIGNNELIAGGAGVLLRSIDGINWNILSNTGAGALEYGAVWNGSQYLFYDVYGESFIQTVSAANVNTATPFIPYIDGVQSKPAYGYWFTINWQDNEYVALTTYGVLTSKDGRSWLTKTKAPYYPYGLKRFTDKVVILGANMGVWTGACATQAASETKVFTNPLYNGYRLDGCLGWANQCNGESATRWCKDVAGYNTATSWVKINSDSSTKTIADNQICDTTKYICGTYSSITCSK